MNTDASTLISVVVPTHNRARLLAKLLSSLEAQSYPHDSFEVIVIGDEGDAGFQVVEDFRSHATFDLRFACIKDDPWKGRSPSAKRNFGVQLARHGWIAFIDDDCIADPGWLAGARKYFGETQNAAIEGEKVIPTISPPTLTYKGLLLFTKPHGFQTANMFYRRHEFIEIGGFDTHFPFYLEDTDLAWSILDRGYQIPHAYDAIVMHPVPPPAPWRLLDGARRSILLPYLYKKHPERFRLEGKKAIARSHVPYLLLDLAVLMGAVGKSWGLVCLLVAAQLALTLAHSYKLFRGCRVQVNEFLVTTVLLPIVPIVSLFQLLRGNVRYKTWIFP